MFNISAGQVRQFNDSKKTCFVYNVEGIRADLMYSNGYKDSVFSGWLCESSHLISDFEVENGQTKEE